MSHADTTLDLLDRSRESLTSGYAASAASARYLAASLAALRAGAAIVAARSADPAGRRARLRRRRPARRLGAHRPGRPRAHRVGAAVLRRHRAAGRGRDRPGAGHRPRGRRPAARRRDLRRPRRPPARGAHRAAAAAARARPLGLRAPWTGSPTSTSPRGSRCATAPRCPSDLVERAAEHGQGALALTDRDGLYGAVRFATACGRAGIAPVLGVDLAVEPLASVPVGGATGRRHPGGVLARAPGRMPAAGFALGHRAGCRRARVRARAPRCAGARSSTPGGRGSPCSPGAGAAAPPPASAGRRCAGWSPRPTCAASGACRSPAPTCSPPGPTPPTATSCDLRTVLAARAPETAAVARAEWVGERSGRAGCSCCSAPTPTSAGRCSPGDASGPATSSRPGRRCSPRDGLAVEVVAPRRPEGTPGCRSHAAHLLALADAAGLPAVLTAAVRHADPDQVRTVDLLDAARRLVVLDSRHLDRVTDAGHLASTAAMHASALEVTGGDRSAAPTGCVAMTALVADECTQQARPDLGIGAVHLPEAEVLGIAPGTDPMQVLAQRCRDAVGRRYPGAPRPSSRSCSPGSTTSSRSSTPWATPPTSSPSPRSPT